MSELVLEKGINGNKPKELDSTEYLQKLIEAIKEDLLTPEQAADLINDPQRFLSSYANNGILGFKIYNRIVKMFFINMMEMKERKKNVQKTLADSVLGFLDEKLSDVGSISAVDMSQIYKNLKE